MEWIVFAGAGLIQFVGEENDSIKGILAALSRLAAFS